MFHMLMGLLAKHKFTDERLDVYEELLEDIKKVFKGKYHKKIDKVKVNALEKVDQLQIKYGVQFNEYREMRTY